MSNLPLELTILISIKSINNFLTFFYFSNVSFTFTDGEQFKTGTIDATAGSICVTNTQIVYVPEPATATLSLLALCGLAARRRRK